MTHPALVLSISIERSIQAVANFLAEPLNFPEWASGLASGLTPKRAYASSADEAAEWITEAPEGRLTIRFSPANDFGVADHWVHFPDGGIVYVPLRTVANGEGAEVMLTLFRPPNMDETRFETDADWVRRDLATLKRILEAQGAR